MSSTWSFFYCPIYIVASFPQSWTCEERWTRISSPEQKHIFYSFHFHCEIKQQVGIFRWWQRHSCTTTYYCSQSIEMGQTKGKATIRQSWRKNSHQTLMWWALSCQCDICVNPTSNVMNGWSVHLSIVGKSVSHSMDWSRGGSSFWASSHLICLFWARSHLIAGSASPRSAPIWKLTTLVSWCLYSYHVVKLIVGSYCAYWLSTLVSCRIIFSVVKSMVGVTALQEETCFGCWSLDSNNVHSNLRERLVWSQF